MTEDSNLRITFLARDQLNERIHRFNTAIVDTTHLPLEIITTERDLSIATKIPERVQCEMESPAHENWVAIMET